MSVRYLFSFAMAGIKNVVAEKKIMIAYKYIVKVKVSFLLWVRSYASNHCIWKYKNITIAGMKLWLWVGAEK